MSRQSGKEIKMPNHLNHDNIWNGHVWKSLDETVRTAVGAIRVAQKVFPTTQWAAVPQNNNQ
jgi:hypothetical protein